ncbi:MAG: S1/P1 nuclease [Candidatus Cyclonatronum sp.]|uniref:S1/P1 nuclease n=1 Tax=Cyclonatronum sp. TaxID=3024185 RepID=UPI0025BFBF71|nr:S1/P1 nuclease [Cyclonatronum sp.]MCH8488237.1 S1/P1 nuclease [Cyclonatronum sp.]
MILPVRAALVAAPAATRAAATALLVAFFIGLIPADAHAWGRTGHYITGEIAQRHLTPGAAAHVERLLGETSLTVATVWMDQVRSTEPYRHTADWHWVTIPDGMRYEEAEHNPNGDVIEALERQIAALKSGRLTEDEERDALRMVIHMIGDMHQPLHVGTGEDRGGNDVRVQWLGRSSNLHRVWDTDMIESWDLTSTQFADALLIVDDATKAAWKQGGPRDWAHESVQYRANIYDLPENLELGWEYRNRNFHIVEKRLIQAGLRIAMVLNEVYGGR